jgi:transposase InsO family protein
VIVAYIDGYRQRFGVEPICAVLSEHGMKIAPSTYYAHRAQPVSGAALQEAYLVNALVTLWQENWGVYGVRKMWHAARRAGIDVGRDQVGRLMAIAGIRGVVRGRHRTITTRRDQAAARHPDLVKRDWDAPSGPDQLWVADFSYVWTLAGFVYVAFVVDVFSRRILGWRVTTSKHTSLVTDALRQALNLRSRHESHWTAMGLVHHSDAGSQYTSVAFTAELILAEIAGSIGTVGDALDNALCESTIGLFKTEAIDIDGPAWRDRREVEWQVARWVHWYNTTRLHSSIGNLPPIEYENAHRQAKTVTPNPEVA